MVEKLSICFPVGGLLIYGEVDKKERPRTSVWVTVTTECREKKAGDCKYDCLHCPYQDFSKERKYLKKYRKAMITAVKLAYAELKKVEDEKL